MQGPCSSMLRYTATAIILLATFVDKRQGAEADIAIAARAGSAISHMQVVTTTAIPTTTALQWNARCFIT